VQEVVRSQSDHIVAAQGLLFVALPAVNLDAAQAIAERIQSAWRREAPRPAPELDITLAAYPDHATLLESLFTLLKVQRA